MYISYIGSCVIETLYFSPKDITSYGIIKPAAITSLKIEKPVYISIGIITGPG